MIQYGAAFLEKGAAILCGTRLVLNHLDHSELINITWKKYLYYRLSLLTCHS